MIGENITITQNERLQALGLLTIGKHLHTQLVTTVNALLHTLKQPEPEGTYDDGHCGDFVWSGLTDVDELLHRLKITVTAAEQETPTNG